MMQHAKMTQTTKALLAGEDRRNVRNAYYYSNLQSRWLAHTGHW